MRTIKICTFLTAVAGCLAFITSCSKELEQKLPQQTDLTNYSQVQVYNAVVGSNRNYITVDGVPVNGATVAYGAVFPSNTYAFSLPSGLRSFVIYDTAAVNFQAPLRFTENFQSNTFYTVFAYDTSTSPKQITVPTTIEIPQDTTARLRFANFAYSTSALPAVDVYSVKRKANIFTNVATTEVTPFIPMASALGDTLLVRATGTTTPNITSINNFSPTQKRSYTMIYRGGATRAATVFVNR
jgi:hypothetical protein